MAILVDYQNVATAVFCKILYGNEGDQVSAASLLGKIRALNVEFRDTYGELILCTDHKSWRVDENPIYKARRRAAKEAAKAAGIEELDEDRMAMDEAISLTREALMEHGHFRVINVRGAEGDDCMAVLAQKLPGRHLIVSADKDMTQLKSPSVDIFHPVKKEMVDNGRTFRRELIIRGDSGDDVPNILSDDDTFLDPDKKQRQMSKKRFEILMNAVTVEDGIDQLPEIQGITKAQILDNYLRNVKLIDLDVDNIPEHVVRSIMVSYETQAGKKGDFMSLLTKLNAGFYASKGADFVIRQPKEHLDLL